MTYAEVPQDTSIWSSWCDDGSYDQTALIARELGLELFVHNRNYGYGANQKTCYREALRAGADIVVMVHPDYQYDPTLLPQISSVLFRNGTADVVLGFAHSRGATTGAGHALVEIHGANRFLTGLENWDLRLTSGRIPHRISRLPCETLWSK